MVLRPVNSVAEAVARLRSINEDLENQIAELTMRRDANLSGMQAFEPFAEWEEVPEEEPIPEPEPEPEPVPMTPEELDPPLYPSVEEQAASSSTETTGQV